jgi:Flp pilus assembly protein TadD
LAMRAFRRAAELRPNSPVPHNNIGLQHLRRGDRAAAKAAFRAGLAAAQPGDGYGAAMVLNNLGLMMRDDGDAVAAADSFRRAHALAPAFETGTNLAAALLDAGRLEDAAEVLAAAEHMDGAAGPGSRPEPATRAAAAAVQATLAALMDRVGGARAEPGSHRPPSRGTCWGRRDMLAPGARGGVTPGRGRCA